MNGVILYQSKYGATRKYAQWLFAATNFDLLEMKQVLYDQVYENREAPQAYAGLTLRSEQVIRDRIIVQGQQMIHAIFQMTPYFYRSPKAGAKRLRALEELDTRISFRLALYQKQ